MCADASLEILGDGIRIRVMEPYTSCPKLSVLLGNSDEEKHFEFPDDDPYLSEDRAFLQGILACKKEKTFQAADKHVLCQYPDAVGTYALSTIIRDRSITK